MGTMFGAIADSALIHKLNNDAGRKKLPTINTIEQCVELIDKSSNILILSGAGISTSAGIADFRSENGLYATLKEKFNLDNPTTMFDMRYFINDPSLFYSFSCDVCPGFDKHSKYYPTQTHYFIKSLEQKSKLLRNYTQNIDTLEMRAGINNVITCHGSYITASCINCQFQCSGVHIQKHIFRSQIPRCPHCCPHKSDLKHLLNIDHKLRTHKPIITRNKHANILYIRLPKLLCTMEYLSKCEILFSFDANIVQKAIFDATELNLDDCNDTEINMNISILVLKCNDTNVLKLCETAIMQWLQTDAMPNSFGVIKPDIVFFNETLSLNYQKTLEKDITKCDLLLVMGTSLQVDPVSSIPNMLPSHVPAILINREVPEDTHIKFDVNLLGNCDDICDTLLHKLKWKRITPVTCDDFKLENTDSDNTVGTIQEIETFEMEALGVEYEYIRPNLYVFPNGKLPPPSYVFPAKEYKNVPRMLSDVDMIVEDIIREEQTQNGGTNDSIQFRETETMNIGYKSKKELLIYGYIRKCIDYKSLLSIMNNYTAFAQFYAMMPRLDNCFFVYGTLRDDIGRIENGNRNEWCDGSEGYLGIVFGYKLFGGKNDTCAFAKKTNNLNDYIIGRIIRWKDELEYEMQLSWADGIKGYEPNMSECLFVRDYIDCYIFDELNDEMLLQMGYYNIQTNIDFRNISKVKQSAVMYYCTQQPYVNTVTPHSDWMKRFVMFAGQ